MGRNTAYPVFDDYYVYVIAEKSDPPTCKIGVARNAEQRLRELQCGNWRQLFLAGKVVFVGRELAHIVEFAVHKRLAAQHLHGEWFLIAPEAAIAEIEVFVVTTKERASS